MMKRRTIQVLVLLVMLYAISSSAEVLVPPCPAPRFKTKDWRPVEAPRLYLLLPQDFREVKIQPIDAYVRCFQSRDSTIIFYFELGSFCDPLTDNYSSRQTEWCSERIGGRLARLITSAPGDRPGMKYIAGA